MEQKHFHEKKAFRFKRFARKAYSAFNSLGRVVSIGVVAGCTLTMMSNEAKAQDGQKPMLQMKKDLDEVMVTASLVEIPLQEATKTITVITQQEIQQAPVQSIQDLLVYVAGIDVVQRGAHGVQADISLRGGSADQTAVLLNGINLSNAQTGHYSFDFPINISDIERIEILHGPSALVYGAGAFSGGINIITKKGVDDKGYVNIEAGMHKARGIEARGATQIGNTTNSLSVGYSASDGYIANSDYDIYNMLWQTRLHLKGSSKIDFQLGYNDKSFGANTFYSAAYPNQYERTSTYMGTVKGDFRVADNFKITPMVYWNRHHDQFDLVKDTDFGRNFHRGDTYGTNLILSYKSRLGTTSFGGELRREDMLSSKLGKPMVKPHRKYTVYDDRTNASAGLEHTVKINKLVLSAGVLINHNTLESDKYRFFPSASAGYAPNEHWKINTSWSKSVRMPSFTDLYYTTETHTADDKLQAEMSESWEIGFKYSNTLVSAYATGYLMWGRNMIDWVKTQPTDAKWSSWNLSKLDTKGVEVGAKLHLTQIAPQLGEDTYLKVDYTQSYQSHDAQDLISLYSLNYVRSKLTTQLNHKIYKGLSAGWYFRYQDRAGEYLKYENLKPTNKVPYPSFTTLDLKLTYKIDNLKLNLNLNNLYNTSYYDLGYVPQAGFWLMGGVNYTFR